MKWVKKGLIFGPDGQSDWAKHSALQPTPVLVGDAIRIYCGMRDEHGVSRIGYVEVDAERPANVRRVSERPVLDVGVPGAFDDNGVVPCAVAECGGEVRLYYSGYQLGTKVKNTGFTGLAVGSGDHFRRYKQTPVTDRNDAGLLFRALHCILEEGGVWKGYLCVGDSYLPGGKTPTYHIAYIESRDGLSFPDSETPVLHTDGEACRLARPSVFRHQAHYHMVYARGNDSGIFDLDLAESPDGVCWTRQGPLPGLERTPGAWDSRMASYPSLLRYKDKAYLFYNGNDMGRQGFGYAELEEWS
jgi:hypothetical protein